MAISKNRPPEGQTGWCVVCGGNIVEEFYKDYDAATVIYGIPRGFTWKSKGINCSKCGLKYAFISDKCQLP